MDVPENRVVLYVHPAAGPSIDIAALSDAIGVDRLQAVTPSDAIERLDAASVVCVVTDPTLQPSALVSVLTAIRRLAPSLPVLAAVPDAAIDVPTAADSTPIVERIVIGDGGVEQLAARIDAKNRAEPPFPRAPVGDYRRLFRKAPAPIVIYDAEGVLQFANDATADLVEVADASQLQGRTVGEFIAPESAETVRDRMRRVLEERQPSEPAVIELETTTGARRYVEVVGEPITYRGEPAGQAVLNDVTERRRREHRLQTERDQFTALFESVPEPVVHVRFEDDEPILENANEAFEETFGYDVDTIRGESLNDYIVPEDKQRQAEQIDQKAKSEGRVEREVTRVAADGERDFLFRSVAFDTDGSTTEEIGIYVDVTERKQRERELQRKNDRLETFAHIVGHDLRNPLNVISGRLELARETGADEHFDAIERGTERMEALLEDLLTLAQQGETVDETTPVELGATVETAWTTVDTGAATLVTENAVGTVQADQSRLTELFENLFRNAVEHGSTDPSVADAPEDAVEHGSTSPDSQARQDAVEHAGDDVTVWVGRENGRLYVEDDGPGIPPDERDDVFEIGYTTAQEGTGYGLAIVEEIAEAHGWSVAVTAGRDGGARFEISGID